MARLSRCLAVSRRNLRRVIVTVVLFVVTIICASLRANAAAQFAEAGRMFKQGQYDQVIDNAKTALEEGQTSEDWYAIKIKAELTRGKYAHALTTFDEALKKHASSIRLRWLGHEVCFLNGQDERAESLLAEINQLFAGAAWKYSDAANRVAVGRYYLRQGADPKQVLDALYDKAKTQNPDDAESFIASGQLALEKHDFGLAAEEFGKASKLDEKDPDIQFGLAQAFAPSDGAKSKQALKAALELNPKHIDSLLYVADDHIDSERYKDAAKLLDQVLETNDKHPRAWAYRAVLAHLENKADAEKDTHAKALAHWKTNPDVDYLIGKKLSQKYRFAEGADYQRKSLAINADYLPAKMQLAQDLLRLGKEEEGWRLAGEVYEKDGYDVVAHNLVTLRDHIAKYTTLENVGFVVRMETREAQIYGGSVLDLLRRAKEQLCTKYDVEISEPVFVEIFPQQQDFAIRTFGLPGGAGFLGVCFGRVITMNSPASQGNSPSNWQSVLWHEFCHVVTLNKTNNKMPRWLSEGISVYEERQANRSWGQKMDPRYREMVLGDDLTPVSELSGAFLSPKSALHLQFAYYESSLVVEYLVEEYGIDTLKRVLVDLSVGMTINDSLGRYTGSLKLLDEEFAKYARQLANDLAPKLDWTKPEQEITSNATALQDWMKDHPNNYWGLQLRARQFLSNKQWEEAKVPLEKLIAFYPDDHGANNARSMLATASRELSETDNERTSLQQLAEMDDDAVDIYLRLMELWSDEKNWEKAIENAERMLAVNPLQRAPHRYLAKACELVGDDARAIEALETLVIMEPLDPADTHYRLAKLYHRMGDLESARRQIIKSLEEAPRFREAHRELLAIVREIEENKE